MDVARDAVASLGPRDALDRSLVRERGTAGRSSATDSASAQISVGVAAPLLRTLSAAAADRLAADRACDRHACTIPARIVARPGSRESAAADSHFSAAPCSRTVALLGFLAVSIVHTTVSVCPGDAAR